MGEACVQPIPIFATKTEKSVFGFFSSLPSLCFFLLSQHQSFCLRNAESALAVRRTLVRIKLEKNQEDFDVPVKQKILYAA